MKRMIFLPLVAALLLAACATRDASVPDQTIALTDSCAAYRSASRYFIESGDTIFGPIFIAIASQTCGD